MYVCLEIGIGQEKEEESGVRDGLIDAYLTVQLMFGMAKRMVLYMCPTDCSLCHDVQAYNEGDVVPSFYPYRHFSCSTCVVSLTISPSE